MIHPCCLSLWRLPQTDADSRCLQAASVSAAWAHESPKWCLKLVGCWTLQHLAAIWPPRSAQPVNITQHIPASMQPAMQPVDGGNTLQVVGGLSGEPLTVHLTCQEAKKIESVRDLKRCIARNVTRPLGRSFQKDKAKVFGCFWSYLPVWF